MKRISAFIVMAVFLLAFVKFTFAASVAEWDYVDQGQTGFTLYFWETANPNIVFTKNVPDPAARQMDIPDIKAGISYSFELTAYNEEGESIRSNRVELTEPTYIPPVDNVPQPTPIPSAPIQIIVHGNVTVQQKNN